ncbi:alanine--tRNA ligase, partial [Desulforudis sp. 1190]|uniref:alanine--tRNA ligase n=1 Tax=Desulforudis sp. 1190 TaxID=3416136 RepID=UPI003CF3A8B9
MRGSEIRQRFLDYFAARDHRVVPSSSLVPANDPTLLWTAAGMVQFKPYYTGAAKPEFKRAATCQKCLRTPDIENVGRTARHHTFFEMLGNFSFGDYFKERAIPWAWEFVTRELGLDAGRLWISIYLDDDEAFEHWLKVGVNADRIVRLGKDTNFWEIGVGPCGPCSEIYYDQGPERGCGNPACRPGCDCDRYLEIWNLVFIQFFRDETGNYEPLPNKGIDTGMGLERVAAVLQNVRTNFDTDIFREIIDHAAKLLGVRYRENDSTDVALKVIADHTRAITFAVADGVLPSNEGRGYVIRRLLRRAARFGLLLGRETPFLDSVAGAVIGQMAQAYPYLVTQAEHVQRVVRREEERFRQTLVQGVDILNRHIAQTVASGGHKLDGAVAFKLYDTYGFPLELTVEICGESGLEVDEADFSKALEEQRERARSARQETEYLSERDIVYRELRDKHGPTEFVGYDRLSTRARVIAILSDGEPVDRAGEGAEVEVVLDTTPCYAESGGQVSDAGWITGDGLKAEITGCVKPVEDLFVHKVLVKEGTLATGALVDVDIDQARRLDTCRNHTATHLLHRALKDIVGEHANQAGSLVAPERLRFDFTHYQALAPRELKEIEKRVNSAVLQNLPVKTDIVSFDEAQALGAMALFGEKYGDLVRVVRVGDYSLELCGGTHVRNSSEIGLFKIITEGSVGAGLRRIEAMTGPAALDYLVAHDEQLNEIAGLIKAPVREVVGRLETVLQNVRKLEKENEQLRDRLQAYEVLDIINQVEDVAGVKVLVAQVKAREMPELRGLVDLLRDRLGPAVIVLRSEE